VIESLARQAMPGADFVHFQEHLARAHTLWARQESGAGHTSSTPYGTKSESAVMIAATLTFSNCGLTQLGHFTSHTSIKLTDVVAKYANCASASYGATTYSTWHFLNTLEIQRINAVLINALRCFSHQNHSVSHFRRNVNASLNTRRCTSSVCIT
jgi:hypothetical protein